MDNRQYIAIKGIVATTLLCVSCGSTPKTGQTDTGDSDDVLRLPDGGIASRRIFTLDGFSKPESALYDQANDTILVSNINGGAGEVDGNGFISRVAPTGDLIELKWIDGEADGIALDAPKGMGVAGDELFVADINQVRVFNRQTGAPIDTIKIEASVFLNDITSDGNRVFVSDSSGSAIYEIMSDHTYQIRATEETVKNPNGLAFTGETLYAADQAGHIIALDSAFHPASTVNTGAESLDGLVVLPDGSLLASSWGAQAVFVSTADTPFTPIIGNLPSPADIGYIPERHMVLIPTFGENTVIGEEIFTVSP